MYLNENDNCSTSLNATYVDDLSNLNGCDTAGYIIRTWSLQDKCGNTTSKNQIIWVEPITTVTTLPDSDTLCSGELTTIKISSISAPTRPVLFRYETRIPYGITVIPGAGNALPNDTIISDLVQNNTDTAKLVLFIVTPYTRHAGSESEKCSGVSDTTKIWVEPVPKVNITPVKDTICTALFPDISSSTVTRSLQPVRLYYHIEYNQSEVEIIHSRDTVNLSPGNSTIRDTIINHSSVPQQVIFIVYPYLLGNNGIPKCPGTPDTSYIWVAPELRIVVDTISTFIGGNHVRCFKENNGFIKLKPTGGITAFTGYDDGDLDYTWNLNRSHSRDTSSLRAGNYSIVIGDKLMCADDSVFNLTQPDTLVNFIREIDKISCLGNDGKLSADTYGGFPGYSYTWTNVADGYIEKTPPILEDTLYKTKDGHYRLVVLDTNGCRGVADTVIQQAPAMNVGAMPDTVYGGVYKVKCHGEYSGELASYSNDTTLRPVIKYEWTGPDGFSMTYTNNLQYNYLHNLKAGTYNLTYTNELGCKGSSQMDMNEPDSMRIHEPQISHYPGSYDTKCFGSHDGEISLHSSGGYGGPYNYHWETLSGVILNGDSIQRNLPADVYTVTVSDSLNFCSTIDTITLIQPDEIIINTDIPLSPVGGYNLNCFGDSTGYIKLQASGGIPPNYQYQWMDDSAAPKDRYNLKAGEYVVTVTDGLGCQQRDTISLTQPLALSIDSVGLSDYNGYNISCNGRSDGSISIIPAGGVTDYTYEWTFNGIQLPENTENLISKPTGFYMLNITDANNCKIIWSDSLIEPTALNLQVTTKNISCTGTNLGTAQAQVTGGIPPYLYDWSNGETTPGIDNLLEADYGIVITDLNLCPVTDTATIIQNTEVQVEIQIINPISCKGLSDGVLVAVAQDGVPPYTYDWGDTGPMTDTYSGLKEGTYSVIVKDNEGCVGNQSLVFDDPDSLEPIIEVVDTKCFGNYDGTVMLNATGGTGAYKFLWNSEFITGNEIGNLKAGKYQLQIQDAKNCVTDTLVSVNQPGKMFIRLDPQNTVAPFCPDWQNGVLSVSVVGGTRNYTYLWDYNNESDSIIRNIKEDSYTLHVTDAQNCAADTTFRLKALNNNCLGIPTAFTPNYDAANDTWEIRYMTEDGAEVSFDEVYPNGVMQVYDRIGNLVYRCTGGCPEDWDGKDLKGRELPVDTYYYIIELNTGDRDVTLKGIVTIIR